MFKKKFAIVLLVTSSFALSACTQSNSFFYAYDKGDCKSTRFDEVERDLDINAQWKYETLYLTWDEYSGDEFYGYYIVRDEGTEDKCPFYYVGGDYYEYIGKKSRTYFKDEDIDSDTTYYYRVCVKETDKEVLCGGVKKISIY